MDREGAETGLRKPDKMDYNVSSKLEQRGILAGMLLGKGARTQLNFYIQHSIKQEDYLLFKKDILEKIARKPAKTCYRRTKKGQTLVRVEPKLIPLTRVLVKKLYPGGTCKIAREFLDLLTPQGIAIWFADKGSKTFKKKNGKIHALEIYLNTYVSKEENEAIATYFSEVWGFKWGLNKSKGSYRLRMGTREGKRFLSFVGPYLPESMLYILETSSNITATA